MVVSSGITHDGPIERGHRQMSKLEDMADDDEVYADSIVEEMHDEAKRVREIRSQASESSLDGLSNDLISPQDIKRIRGRVLASSTAGPTIGNAVQGEDVEVSGSIRRGRMKRKVSSRRNKGKGEEGYAEASGPTPAGEPTYDEVDRKFLLQGILDSQKLAIDPRASGSRSADRSESRDLRYLFEKKFTIDAGLRQSQLKLRFDTNFEDPFIGKIPIASPSAMGDEYDRDKERLQQNSLLQLLDNQQSSANKGSIQAPKDLMNEENPSSEGAEWDMLEFGRAPDPDYSLYHDLQARIWTHRAKLAFKDLQRRDIKLDTRTLTWYLSVFCESLQVEEVGKVLSLFRENGLSFNKNTYHTLIRMYLRLNDVSLVNHWKNEALAQKIRLDADSFGLIIRYHVRNDNVVDALKSLEEAKESNLNISEYYIHSLRKKCDELGISHPDIPQDPQAWLKHMKDLRQRKRHSSRSKIQDLLTIL
jgi:hypothetical protein